MKDVLAEASAIAELRDLDRLQPFLDELTTWRPEHPGVCEHCQASLVAYSQRLILKHQLPPAWAARMLQKLFAYTDDADAEAGRLR